MLRALRSAFDPFRPSRWIGKTVLIGIRDLDGAGEEVSREQLWGEIALVDRMEGFAIRLKGNRLGETMSLPPAPRWFKRARPGVYTLRSTGEQLENPDFLVTVIRERNSDS